jgi:hypothetical protein
VVIWRILTARHFSSSLPRLLVTLHFLLIAKEEAQVGAFLADSTQPGKAISKNHLDSSVRSPSSALSWHHFLPLLGLRFVLAGHPPFAR